MIARLRGWAARLRDRALSTRADRAMDEEIRFHIEMETEKNVREGMDPREARRRALVTFGGAERHRARLREGRSLPFLDALGSDLRFALRSIRRARGAALVSVASIAVGVGASTTVFGIANGLLFQDPPVPAPRQLVRINEVRTGRTSGGVEGERVTYPRIAAYRERTGGVFAAVAGHRNESFALRLEDGTYAVTGSAVTGSYFEAVGVTPFLGRFFVTDSEPVVVISHRLWRERFFEDPEVVGRTVYVDSRPFSVAGVTPETFGGLTPPVLSDLWVPAVAHRADAAEGGFASWVALFGRLHPGVERRQAATVVESVGLGIAPMYAETTVRAVDLEPLRGMPGDSALYVGGFLAMLLGMALLLLFIASANIAGMLLARALARRREVAIRLAIGAGRVRLVRHHMAEALVLFAVGGVGGVAISYAAASALEAIPFPETFGRLTADFSPDPRVLVFALVVTALTGVLFSLVPALRASGPDLVPSLRDGGRWSASRGWGRDAFVCGQVAMSVLLLLVAGLFARSLQRGLSQDLGFDPDGVVLAETNLSPHGYDTGRVRAFYRQLVEAARAVPGVEGAALSQLVLLNGDRWGGDVQPEDDAGDGDRRANAGMNVATPDFLDVGGLRLAAGRWFTERDGDGSPPVAVINETMAERLWPGANPVGEAFRMGDARFEVVGVLEEGKYVFMLEGPTAYFYLPFAQAPRMSMILHVRAPGQTAATQQAVRDIVRGLDPNVAVEGAETHAEVVDFAVFPQRFAAGLVGAFGLVGLILSAVGVYGVLSFQVAQRTREFGVRKALGARSSDLLGQVLRRGVLLAAGGCAIGWLLGVGVGQLLESFLVGLSPMDAPTFVGVPVLLLLVAAVASLIPALRVTSVEAADTLPEE